jgi:hypothetical protein
LPEGFSYTSENARDRMTEEELQALLDRLGFLAPRE